MDGKLLGLDYDLLVTSIGLLVAGMAAIIGIWVERDARRPARYAVWLSVLIGLATGVSMFQTYDDDQDQKKVEADLARVLHQLDKIATDNDIEIPELNELIKSELAAQSRANPNVVEEFAQRVSDEGDDPSEVVGAYLPASEVESIQRKGTFTPKPKSKPVAAPPENKTASLDAPAIATPEARKERRSRLSFGGPPRLPPRVDPSLAKPKTDEPKTPEAPPEPAKDAPKEAAKDAPIEPKRIEVKKLGLGGEVGKPPIVQPVARPAIPKPNTATPVAPPKLQGLRR